MPVFRLTSRSLFPAPELAEPGGLLAVGGDLSPARLLLAYSMGIFPWYNEGEPILWWSPDPRCVLLPAELKVSRSLSKVLRKAELTVTFDRDFRQVISRCGEVRRRSGEGTWITAEMLEAYGRLHDMGFAHSVECWRDGRLAGGLYGICLGRCFFGESMFHQVPNASKVAFAALADHLRLRGFEMIDCQLPTAHLKSLGAREMPRAEFLRRLVAGGVLPSSMPPPAEFP